MRNEAIAQLEAVIEGVSGPVPSYISPARGLEGVPRAAVLHMCHQCIEDAVPPT